MTTESSPVPTVPEVSPLEYIKIRVMANGSYFDCYQVVRDGIVLHHVGVNGEPVKLPDPHESYVLSKIPTSKPE